MGPLHDSPTHDSTLLALRLLALTRGLLGGGTCWRPDKLATNRFGFSCDPLSRNACFFSLVGAATRARWEMREQLAEAGPGEIRIVHILKAMSAAPGTPYSGELGWRHVESILSGLENALMEYDDAPVQSTRSRA